MDNNTVFVVIIALVFIIVLISLIVSNVKQKAKINEFTLTFKTKEAQLKLQATEWGMQELEKFKATELEEAKKALERNAIEAASNLLERWKFENEGTIRADAINRSYSVNLGKITEHLIPYHPNFKFNPRDTRFIGSPIDLIVFDGISENKPEIKIYFIEVKTGTSRLTPVERKIKFSVENKLIEWLEINPATLL